MDPVRVLVTGASGFLGRHLLARLSGRGRSRLAVLGRAAPARDAAFTFHQGDLLDRGAVHAAVRKARPDWVFHLAYLRAPSDPEGEAAANVAAFENLAGALEAQTDLRRKPIRLVTVGSAAEIGPRAAAHSPVSEATPCEPTSPYGQTKLRLTQMALDRASHPALEVIVARVFNVIGPGQDERLVLGNIAKQLRSVLRGLERQVRCGPLDARRDFIDTRDVAAALELLAERGSAGELYNVCSGSSHRIGDLARSLADLACVAVPFTIDPALSRPGDPTDIFGDPSKIANHLGWQPTIPIERSLADLWHGEKCA